MENLEQIITKQNNIKEKIDEYNRDFELYNKTYIEKFTELKTLKNEFKYEKNSVQKDDDKIKVLNFKIQSMSIEISSMANQVKEIQTNINDMKLEQEQLKEELLENPEVKRAVYTEEKRRVQELKDAKILEKREIDTLLQNNPKNISEIPKNIADKISKDSLYKQYDEQISNFTELLNTSSNPRAKSSLENKIKTLEKEKEEFLISKIKEIATGYQNSIHIYEKELQTLAVKEAKVILDRHNGVYNGTSRVEEQKVFDDSKNSNSKTSDEKETKTKTEADQSNTKDESQQTDTKSKDENDENTNNSRNDINDPSDNSDFKSKIMEEDIKNLPKKIGFFDKFKEKFLKVKDWLKDQFDNFKLTTVPMPEKNTKNDKIEINTNEKDNAENNKNENEAKAETKKEKEAEEKKQEKQKDDHSKNMNNTDTENNKEEEKTEKENSKETEDNKEYTNSNYTQKEILDNEDIRKKIEDYMNNLEKKHKNNSNKEKENSTRESKEKEEI